MTCCTQQILTHVSLLIKSEESIKIEGTPPGSLQKPNGCRAAVAAGNKSPATIAAHILTAFFQDPGGVYFMKCVQQNLQLFRRKH